MAVGVHQAVLPRLVSDGDCKSEQVSVPVHQKDVDQAESDLRSHPASDSAVVLSC